MRKNIISLALPLCFGLPLLAYARTINTNPNLLNVQAKFYDHEIGGVDGEFGARKPGVCGYNKDFPGPTGKTWAVTPNMVLDTLPYSKELGKKIPQVGINDCNSASLTKWFDPAFATGVSCQDLPFAKVLDSVGTISWKYADSLFFPIDSMAPAGQLEGKGDFSGMDMSSLTFPPGFTGKHNFNWCMEINAQFKYHGGEVFNFKGDDDVWVYLDNKLVVDLGGMHGATSPPKPVLLDSLPYIAGKAGETFDFDLYFCERRPGGSSFEMKTSLDLKPVIFQDLEIVRGDGKVLNPKNPVTGPTRLCALPAFVQSFCGNQASPPSGTFYPSTWTLDGQVIARDSSCINLDPLNLPPNRHITLAAKAEGKTAKLNIQVLKTNRPLGMVLKGNGRLESLEIPMDPKSDSLEAPIRIDYPFAGVSHSDSAGQEKFNRSRRSVILALADKDRGPCGVSGLDSGKGLVSQTVIGFPATMDVTLQDSITPALRHASWQPSPHRSDLQLDFVPSETMNASFSQDVALVFKNRAGATYRMDLRNAQPIGPGIDSFRVAFPANAPFQPKDVDSVSFRETMKDLSGNAAQPLFIAIPSVAWSSGEADIAGVTLESDPVKGGGFEPILAPNPLVVVNPQGTPLDPGGDNAKLAEAKGPVLLIRSAEPLDRLEAWVYTNLGAFVSHGVHTFSESEWDAIQATVTAGDTATARIMWYPAADGAKLGTGAYIIKGTVTTRRSFTQNESGLWSEKIPTLKIFGPLRFGYLRR